MDGNFKNHCKQLCVHRKKGLWSEVSVVGPFQHIGEVFLSKLTYSFCISQNAIYTAWKSPHPHNLRTLNNDTVLTRFHRSCGNRPIGNDYWPENMQLAIVHKYLSGVRGKCHISDILLSALCLTRSASLNQGQPFLT